MPPENPVSPRPTGRKSIGIFGVLFPLFLAAAPEPAAAGSVPFGSHLFPYAAGSIVPTGATQAEKDQAVRDYYDDWKAAYLRQGCGAGRWYVEYQPSGELTVSEAHGYGMLIAALMAGHDPQARTIFDGMYLYFRDHPTSGNPWLMSWQQDRSCNNVNGANSATDGDLDIAFALLLADRQWGSCGAVDYRSAAVSVIQAIRADDLDATTRYTLLGNWAASGAYYDSTRSSDFMTDHYRSF